MMFKVGDIIFIRDDLEAGKKYEGWELREEMLEFRGKKAKVIMIDYELDTYYLDIDNERYDWKGSMFVQPLINIYVIGSKIIAQQDDRTGVVHCHLDDEFDLTGAKLALERLEEAVRIPKWLRMGAQYYVASILNKDMYLVVRFHGDNRDKWLLARGLAFRTPEEAIEATKKMLKALRK